MRTLFFLAASLAAVPASAATWLVDQDGQATAASCGGTAPAFSAIGVALSAAAAGDTILICPGTGPYNEQLTIDKAVTLKGFTDTRVVIRPAPMSANTTNLYSGSPIAAVIVVNGVNASIGNVVVDGGGAGLGTDCSSPNLAGIFYRNAAGTVSDSTVQDIWLAPGLEGCQAGLGIFAQSGGGGTTSLVVSGTNVSNYQKNGIVGNEVGTTLEVTNSYVAADPNLNASVQNGIQIGFGATGAIRGNRVANLVYQPCTFPYTPGGGCDVGASFGVLVFDAEVDVIVDGNTIVNTQGGIYVGGGIVQNGTNRADISSNIVSGSGVFDGIVVVGDGHVVTKNTVTKSDRSGVLIYGNDNLGTSNRIQDAPVGIWNLGGTGNTFPPTGTRRNTFVNVDQPILLPAAARSQPSSPPVRIAPAR